MLRSTLTASAAVLALALVLSSTPASAVDTPEAAKAVAEKALKAGAALFDSKDAKGLAETYADDAVLTIVTRDKDTRLVKKDVRNGRPDIEAFYQQMFTSESMFHAKNTVEHARWAGEDAVTIVGVFETDATSADSMKLSFVQTRVKQGGAWRIIDLQVFFLPEK